MINSCLCRLNEVVAVGGREGGTHSAAALISYIQGCVTH